MRIIKRTTWTIVLAVAACVVAAPPSALATFPGTNGKIAFVREDASGNQDIWVMDPDGSDEIRLTNDVADDFDPAWSRDGSRIAFASSRDDGSGTSGTRLYIMDADGGNLQQLTFGETEDRAPSWSPDGSRLVFFTPPHQAVAYLVNADGTGREPLGLGANYFPTWSPDGEPIAYADFSINTINPDGGGWKPVGGHPWATEPDWSPDHQRLAFWRFRGEADANPGIYTITPDVSNAGTSQPHMIPGTTSEDARPVWSPDGSMFAFDSPEGLFATDWEIVVVNSDGTGRTALTDDPGDDTSPAWQPVDSPTPVTGYPRPQGASPMRAALVPAYYECREPNRRHGPPLGSPSCSPPEPVSPAATVGTPDANGHQAQSVGAVRLSVVAGDPDTAADEADVTVSVQLSDVRCREPQFGCAGGALSDYIADLTAYLPLRITDRYNGYANAREATLQDNELDLSVPCAATEDATVGATCSHVTTLEALIPGAVPEGRRSIWGLGEIRVEDAGQDGFPGSVDDNFTFAVPGIFVP